MTRRAIQHYVPQFYLRGFSPDARSNKPKEQWSIRVFDKPTLRAFPAKIRKISGRRDFYLLPVEPDPAGLSPNIVDDLLTGLESRFAPTLRALLLHAGFRSPIDQATRRNFSIFLAYQYVRTEFFRQDMIEGERQTRQSIVDLIVEMNRDKIQGRPPIVTLSEGGEPAVHANYVLNADLISKAASSFMGHSWVLLHNKTDTPFYTSDCPIYVHSLARTPFVGVGIRSPHAEIAFPLSSRALLVMFGTAFRQEAAMWGEHATALPDQVEYYNARQVASARRQVYCREMAFDLARTVCEEHPRFTEPSRTRMKVVRPFAPPPDGRTRRDSGLTPEDV